MAYSPTATRSSLLLQPVRRLLPAAHSMVSRTGVSVQTNMSWDVMRGEPMQCIVMCRNVTKPRRLVRAHETGAGSRACACCGTGDGIPGRLRGSRAHRLRERRDLDALLHRRRLAQRQRARSHRARPAAQASWLCVSELILWSLPSATSLLSEGALPSAMTLQAMRTSRPAWRPIRTSHTTSSRAASAAS